MRKIFSLLVRLVVELLAFPLMLIIAVLSRYLPKTIDIGLGPEPLINNIYHKKALIRHGYKAETFVTSIYFITNEFDWKFVNNYRVIRLLLPFVVFGFVATRFRCVYLYFNGGPLAGTHFIWRFEPLLLRLAAVRTVVMPYGSDIQCMDRCPNLLFRHAMSKDYPKHKNRQSIIKQKIDLWSVNADHVIAGCDWVDYLFCWDTLMLAHFSIDTDLWRFNPDGKIPRSDKPLRVLHAPNHRELKGTSYIIQAIEELCLEGVLVELVLVEKMPNDQLRKLMMDIDVVADQLIIGWYAMFALEAMSLGKPVLCYVRKDLEQLYIDAGIIGVDEIPLIHCSPSTVKDVLRRLALSRNELQSIGQRGRVFVEKHHSLECIGKTFDRINRSMGVKPRLEHDK